jgi:uncharacterized cupredoxin-like copper-binding protein
LSKVIGAAVLAVALVAFIACGGSSGGIDEAKTAGEDEAVPEGGSGSVHVALNEWDIRPIEGSAFEINAGDAVFEIHNQGAAPHDLKIIKTDLAPGALPIRDGTVDLEAAGDVVGGVDPLLTGEVALEEVHLGRGNYVLVCTVPGHFDQGMTTRLQTS